MRKIANALFAVAAAATLAGIIWVAATVRPAPVDHHYPVGIGCGHNGTVQQDGTCKGEH